MKLWLLVILILCATPVLAESVQPVVRVEVSPTEVVVGQSVRLRVTVLVPTWFTKPSAYPSFELANTITRLPPDSSFNTTVRVNSETWTGISRDYQINPQIAAVYNLDGLRLRVNYAHPETRQSTPADVAVPTVRFTAIVPEAASMLDPFLAGSDGTLERQVDGELEGLQAGDAIVVTVTSKLRGMPAMFLPEMIPPMEQLGLMTYPKEPVVKDGEVASRTEQVTYIFSNGGNFTLPPLALAWWNPNTEQIERSTVAPLVVSVAGAPASNPEQQTTSSNLSWLVISGWLAAFTAVFYLLNKCSRLLVRWRMARLARRQASEPFAFRALTNALDQSSPNDMDLALHAWLKRLDGQPSLLEFSQASGGRVYEDILALNRSRHSSDPTVEQPNLSLLTEHLRHARAQYLSQCRDQQDVKLPPLNPGYS